MRGMPRQLPGSRAPGHGLVPAAVPAQHSGERSPSTRMGRAPEVDAVRTAHEGRVVGQFLGLCLRGVGERDSRADF